ncbi:ARM repeat-containing protein [Hypoxylon crocopeplum]|nr:ARM repeat-containing protein [Hypoxylon crocopeplum]
MINTMETSQIPTTLPEVEQLVRELYQPNRPEKISRIQEILQGIQKSPEGWQIAEALILRPDSNVKFFAALTFTVKLNTETLETDDAISVLQKLVAGLIAALHDGNGNIAVVKICGTLVTHFIRHSHVWPLCIRNLSCWLINRTYVHFDEIIEPPPVEDMVRSLSRDNFLAILLFAQSLAFEAKRIDVNSSDYIAFHERVRDNCKDLKIFLTHSIPHSEAAVAKEAMHCLRAWLKYANTSPNGNVVIENLRELALPLIDCLSFEELQDDAMELLIYSTRRWDKEFPGDHYELLYPVFESDWARAKYNKLLKSDTHEDELQFGEFLVAFGENKKFMTACTNKQCINILTSLVGLLGAEGYPEVDDKIFFKAITFWENFIFHLQSWHEAKGLEIDLNKPPGSLVMQAASIGWRKIQQPPTAVYKSWEPEEQFAFKTARKHFCDFLGLVYPLAPKQIVSSLVQNTMEAFSISNWAEFETLAYCLYGVADFGATTEKDILKTLFSSGLLESLHRSQDVVPVYAMKTFNELIVCYKCIFTTYKELVPDVLSLLFGTMSDQHFAESSATSIHKLCSTSQPCRLLLTSEVGTFLDHYESWRNQGLDLKAEEKISGAIAYVIRDVPDDTQKANAFQRLMIIVGVDIESSLRLASYGEGLVIAPDDPIIARAYDLKRRTAAPVRSLEVAFQLAIRVVHCLLNIAKGLQKDDGLALDSDGSDDESTEAPTTADLGERNVDIMRILIQLRDTFSSNSEVVDKLCKIIKAGLSETKPGPFVFPPEMVVDFLTSGWQNDVDKAVKEAATLVTCSNKHYPQDILRHLLVWVLGLLHQISDPDDYPELARNGIELIQKIMTSRALMFMAEPPEVLEFIFAFAIKMMHASSAFKDAAVDFWVAFITLKSPRPDTQERIDNAMLYVGPQLCESLIRNVGGEALRSDVDRFSRPIVRLATRHIRARTWFHAALHGPAFPSDRVGAKEKDLFLKKIISLRGRTTEASKTVREFWQECRGSAYAYAS